MTPADTEAVGFLHDFCDLDFYDSDCSFLFSKPEKEAADGDFSEKKKGLKRKRIKDEPSTPS